GRGIGAACAEKFAREGWQVALHGNESFDRAEALAARLGGRAWKADVSDSGQVDAMVDSVLDAFGSLDALVCNAGISVSCLLQDMTDDMWRRLMGADLDGVFYCCRRVIPHMVSRKQGRIVNISSMWGQQGASCEAAYSAAKAGVIGLTQALARELGPSGITANCVAPGVIDTDMLSHLTREDLDGLAEGTPLGRLGTPEDVARAVFFLCSPEASFITGQVLGVNGGIL
ncbi:MAG: 3-oxoacyl-ACP reductase FabG, partial [Oscillospiraceae bacterium]|nr:3-oxoacyl-ACP reductase FabG [Oscillospiraceae bacterium]